jgi:hypothetical protein
MKVWIYEASRENMKCLRQRKRRRNGSLRMTQRELPSPTWSSRRSSGACANLYSITTTQEAMRSIFRKLNR